jgi:hypothetical protein
MNSVKLVLASQLFYTRVISGHICLALPVEGSEHTVTVTAVLVLE